MTTFTLAQKYTRFPHLIPGLAISAVLTAAAMWLGDKPAIAHLGLGALTLAILLGMIVGNLVPHKTLAPCHSGIHFAKARLLRLGIILYGFRLTFSQIAGVGISGLIIDILTLTSTFVLACWLGQKVFKMDRQTSWLIGAGSSICGAAAVLATEPVVKAEASKVTVAVATVVIFGTLAIFIYPLLWPLLEPLFGMNAFGVYIGSTVHEVAQVVAAGQSINPQVESSAVIAKMLRVMLLAPFLLLLAVRVKQVQPGASASKITVPWFALLFIGVAIFNSFHLLPPSIVHALIQIDSVFLAMAMAALGLTTHLSAIRQAGVKPMLMAALLFGWLIIGGGLINLGIHHLFA